MKREFIIKTPDDLKLVVTEILEQVERQDRSTALILALCGDLGAGKTTFTQVLGRTLGITEPITSPTFTIMKTYQVDTGRFDTMVHLDAYRIEDASELVPLKLLELLQTPRLIACIEWPERIIEAIPQAAWWIDIEIIDNEERKITLQVGMAT